MKEIIQICVDGTLYALTKDGKVYYRDTKEKQICNGDKYKQSTEWEIQTAWYEIKNTSIKEIRVQEPPF